MWDNLRTPLDQDIVYPCKTNMRIENTTEWKSEVGNCVLVSFASFEYPLGEH